MSLILQPENIAITTTAICPVTVLFQCQASGSHISSTWPLYYNAGVHYLSGRRSKRCATPSRSPGADAACLRSALRPSSPSSPGSCIWDRRSQETEPPACWATECRRPPLVTLSAPRPRLRPPGDTLPTFFQQNDALTHTTNRHTIYKISSLHNERICVPQRLFQNGRQREWRMPLGEVRSDSQK